MGSGRDKKKKHSTNSAKTKGKEVVKKTKEDDIDSLLKEFSIQQDALFKVTEESVACPSARSNAALFHYNDFLFLFGGEAYVGNKTLVFNDLLKYNISKNTWTRISCPNSPAPRSSHQLVTFPTNIAFLFGGEFTSPNETQFFHYKDFWSLDLTKYEWTKIDGKLPPPRSGHRMQPWKHYIILFGGFFDSGSVKYYNDLWVFDTKTYKWSEIKTLNSPAPRSGFQFTTFNDSIILYGGYSKHLGKGLIYTDMWILDLNIDQKLIKWSQRKTNGPTKRSGCTMIPFKNRLIMIGGVEDVEQDDVIKSVCLNQVWVYIVDSNKWFQLNLKPDSRIGCDDDQDVDVEDIIFPWPRFNTMTTVVGKNLFMYGGILETKNREITLNDLWSFNADTPKSWKSIIYDEIDVTKKSEDEDDEWSDEEEEEEAEQDQPRENVIRNENYPLPLEPLNVYFTRTIAYWQVLVLEEYKQDDFDGVKAIRKSAFDACRVYWQDNQEKMNELAKFVQEHTE